MKPTPSNPIFSRFRRASFFLLAFALVASAVLAQPSISVDYQGPSSIPFGGPLDSGGVYLTTPGPGPAPLPALLYGPIAIGIVPGAFNTPELDAMSWGEDTILKADSSFGSWGTHYQLILSTDEFANGDPALFLPPDLFTEGSAGNREASADVQIARLTPGQALPPVAPGPFYGHSSWLDGNGFVPFGGQGVGLREPNPPSPGAVPDRGDTIDALDWKKGSDLYFSLDAQWADPMEAPFANSATAVANGVRPGDVLFSTGGGAFNMYAPFFRLGLGIQDDLDALILWENGNGVFEPSVKPFDWQFGTTDMLLFSVRRGSPIIGTPDAFFGIPIEEGDILTTPPGGPGTPPGIFIAAEVLGLATVRSGTNFLFPFGDDLNAMSVR